MPVDYRDYSPEWDDIRAAVLAVGHCEFCGKNGGFGLAVCHLDGDVTNNRRANLKAGCTRCHIAHDKEQHRANAAATVAARRGVAVGIDWDKAISAIVSAGRLVETFGRGQVQLLAGLAHIRADAALQRVKRPSYYAKAWACDKGTVKARIGELLDAEWCELDGVTVLNSRAIDITESGIANDLGETVLTGIHTNGNLYNTHIHKITKIETALPDGFHLHPETITTLQVFQEVARTKRRVDISIESLQDYVEFHFVPQNQQHGTGSCNWQARLKAFLWGDLGTGQLWKRCGLEKPVRIAEVAAVAAKLRKDWQTLKRGSRGELAPDTQRLAVLIRQWEQWGRDPGTVARLHGLRDQIPKGLAEMSGSYRAPTQNHGPTIQSARWDAALDDLALRMNATDIDFYLRKAGRVVADGENGVTVVLPDELHVECCAENYRDELNSLGCEVHFVPDQVKPPGFDLPMIYQQPDFEALARLEIEETGKVARKSGGPGGVNDPSL